MKNRKILYVALFILVIAALFPTAMAYMFKQTQVVQNEFIPAQVSCVVNEIFNGTTKNSVTVTNTSDIAAYIRVRVVSYWQDTKGNIVARPSKMPTFQVTNNWIKADYDTYYYNVPVASWGEVRFLAEGSEINLIKEKEDYNGETYEYNQVVEIFAEAIQSEPADAVTSAWNVTLGVDSEGNNFISGVNTTQNNN